MTLTDAATPRFALPLAVLDDPAFSPDPRSHPHFPLTHASAYRALPSKPPPTRPPQPHPPIPLSPSPTPSLATSYSQSLTRTPVPSLSKLVSKRALIPEILPKSDRTSTPLVRVHPKPVTLQDTNTPRKGRVKALVRRLTSHHNLDRIDELDETDPFGGSYHHDGPYEAIDGNLTQPLQPYGTPLSRGNVRRLKLHEFQSHALHLDQHQSASTAPFTHGETGFSLNLKPGQILQQSTLHISHASGIAPAPGELRTQPNAIAVVTRPDHSRSLSLPNTQTRSSESSDDFQNRPSSLHVPVEHHSGESTPYIPNSLPPHHDCDAAPCVLRQTGMIVFPPPRYESRFHGSSPTQSPQRTSQLFFNSMSQQVESTESAPPASPPHDPRHKSRRSLDGPSTINSTVTQSSPSVQNKPLEPPRIRHLPKRLVMPAPLQRPPPQLQYRLPLADAAAWKDEFPNDHALEDVHFKLQPAMYSQEPKLLRKRSSIFPARTPIPDHVPMPLDNATPMAGNSSAGAANETEGTKERTRRRKLSKRKNDI